MSIASGQTITAADILGLVSIETTTGTTHSLTTVASQKVIVIAKGSAESSSSGQQNGVVSLKYNAVTKDTVNVGSYHAGSVNFQIPFCVIYTETPGAATHDITVTATGYTLTNVVIVVVKLKQS